MSIQGEDSDGRPPTGRRRRFVGPALCCIIPAVVVVGLGAYPIVRNNFGLNDWKAQLMHQRLPAGAELQDAGTEYGNFEPTGNHCDARAWIVISTSQSAEEVQSYFRAGVHNDDVEVWAEPIGNERVRVTIGQSDLFDQADDFRCS